LHVNGLFSTIREGGNAEKQAQVLDFIEFLVSRQPHTGWTVEQRREIVASTMGRLRHTHTSSQAFAQRKQDSRPTA